MAAGEQEKAEEAKTATLTIDGREVTVPVGARVIDAAKLVDVDVAHYCYHSSLSIAGSCRLCLVEVEGMPKLTIACNTEVRDGMVVSTESEQARQAREGMMEFLLANHPLDCPICDKGGECLLQRYSMDHGAGDSRMVDERRVFPKDSFDPLIDLERNRCIVCTRCVRFMDEIAGEHILGMVNRGNMDMIATYNNEPISTNIFSGNVVDICPVGALTSKPYRFKARPWELQQAQGTCLFCSAGCRVTHWVREGCLMRTTTPSRPAPVNFKLDEDTEEFICNVGRYGNDFVNEIERLTASKIDEVDATTEAAVAAAATRLKKIVEKHGPEAVGVLVSPRRSCEEMFLANRLARAALGTNNIDWRGELIDPAAAKAWSMAFNYANGRLDKLDDYDTILVVNGHIGDQAPVAALKLKEAARLGKSKLIMLGYRHDEWLAAQATAELLLKPGQVSDVLEVFSGMMQEADGGTLYECVTKLSKITGAKPQLLEQVLNQLKNARQGLIVYGLSELSGLNAARLTHACVNFAIPQSSHWHTLPFVGERNAQGAFGLGLQPDRLPRGFIDDEQAVQRVAEHWDCQVPQTPGLSTVEQLHAAASGELKALYLIGADVLANFPDRQLLAQAMANLELLIVQDAFPSALAEKAHIVLAGASFLENEGTYVDLNRALAPSARVTAPPAGARRDVEIVLALLEALDQKMPAKVEDASGVFRQTMTMLEPPCPQLLGDQVLKIADTPCPERCLTDIRRKHRHQEGKFHALVCEFDPQCLMVSGSLKQQKWSFTPAESGPLVENENELVLTWAPILTGDDPWLRASTAFETLRSAAVVELHPDDAAKLGLVDGDEVIVGENGEGLKGVLKVTEHIAPGVVFIAQNAFHFELGADTRTLPNVKVVKAEK